MTFHSFLLHPAVQSVGWVLLHFVWEGALLAALYFVLDLLIGRSRARLNYALGCLTMVSMPAIFVGTAFQAPATAHVAVSMPKSDRPAVAAQPFTQVQARDVPVGSARTANPLPGWAVCWWLAGVMVFSLYTAVGWLRVSTLKRCAIAPLHCDSLELPMRRLRISRSVRLCASAMAEVPAVIGWLRPVILLPVAALAGLSESQLRAVLAHELAHIRRHDALVNMIQTVVETLLFYHPAVWWVSHRIREEREHCCDDLAVSVCGDVMVYAGALAQLEELRGAIAEPALAATGGDLLARIRRRLGEQTTHSVPVAAIAATLLLAAAIGIAAAQSPPPKFEVVSVKPCDPRTMQPGARSGPVKVSVGRFDMECLTLQSFLMMAYVDYADGVKHRIASMQLTPVEGVPDWARSARYTIDAKTDFPVSMETMRGPMLAAVLEDRFQVKTHHETREIPIYELTVAKGGLKLHPAAEGSCTVRDPGNPRRALAAGEKPYCGQSSFSQKGLNIQSDLLSVTMEEFADWILLGVDRLVYDKTGIKGKYDFQVEYAVDETMRFFEFAKGEETPDPYPSLAANLDQFGLKLVPAKGPGQFVVVDHIERPSEN